MRIGMHMAWLTGWWEGGGDAVRDAHTKKGAGLF